jgi:DNA repair protein SbcC/Rad50
MILKTLTLINFRKFKTSTIDFPDGVTGIVGLNGVGKSTIFEAVAWVLYGSVAARTSSDQIRRESALSSEPCRVELDFIFEENSYRIVREMTGKSLSSSATVTVNGKIAATGAEIVTSYIQKKLGMDFKSFFTSIFAKQKELNALSSMVASERRPLILRMLGIDSLDDVIKQIKLDRKEKDLLIEKINKDLVDSTGNVKIDVFTKEIKNLEKQKSQDEKINKKLQEKIKSLEKKLKETEKKYILIKNNYEKIKDKKEELAQQKIKFDEKEKLAIELKNLNNDLNEREKIIALQKKKLTFFKDIELDIKSLEKRLNEINNKIEDFIKKIEQKKTLNDRYKKDIGELELKKKKIKEIGPNAKCPTCERVLSDQFNNLLKKFDEEISKEEKDIESFLKEIKKLSEEKEIYIREQQALEKKKNYLQTQLREKEKIKTTIENIVKEIEKEKIHLNKKQEQFEKLKKIKFDKKELEVVTNQVQEYYVKYQSLIEERDNKKDEISSKKIDLERKASNIKLILQKIENLKEKIVELEGFKKKLKENKIVVQHLGMLSEVMSDFRTHLISRIRPTLSYYSSDFFKRLTDGKYSELELDENYNLLVYDNGFPYDIERFSGGEEDLANLCLRLAISEVITERAGGVFNFIILDEIFGSQDIYRRQNIMKALNGLTSKFRQIFLITHIDELKNDMENIIFVTENEDGISLIKIK